MDSSTKNALFIVGVVLATIVVAFVSLLIGAMIFQSKEDSSKPTPISPTPAEVYTDDYGVIYELKEDDDEVGYEILHFVKDGKTEIPTEFLLPAYIDDIPVVGINPEAWDEIDEEVEVKGLDGDGVIYRISSDRQSAELLDATQLGEDTYEILNKFYNMPVKNIKEGAFLDMDIKEITISENVENIERSSFWGCTELTTLYLNSPKLKDISVTDGDDVWYSDIFTTHEVDFYENYDPDYKDQSAESNITEIYIGENMTHIPARAFEGAKIKTIFIPKSIVSIGEGAFSYCKELEEVIFEEGNNLVTIDDFVFDCCTNLKSIIIPNGVKKINNGMFYACRNLTQVNLPNNLTSIGDDVFTECERLASLTIPNSVTNIGGDAFSGCKKLTTVNIPNKLKTIAWGTFAGCVELDLVIPSTVTTLERYALGEVSAGNSIKSVKVIGRNLSFCQLWEDNLLDHAFYKTRTKVYISENDIYWYCKGAQDDNGVYYSWNLSTERYYYYTEIIDGVTYYHTSSDGLGDDDLTTVPTLLEDNDWYGFYNIYTY